MAEANANSQMQRGHVVHGARFFLAVDGKMLGYCPNVTMSRTTNFGPVEVLDNIETEEHVALGYTVAGSFGAIAVTNRTMIERGVQVAISEILNDVTKVFTLMDRPTDSAQWTLEGVSLSGDSLNIGKGQITTVSFNWMALRRRDRKGVIC